MKTRTCKHCGKEITAHLMSNEHLKFFGNVRGQRKILFSACCQEHLTIEANKQRATWAEIAKQEIESAPGYNKYKYK